MNIRSEMQRCFSGSTTLEKLLAYLVNEYARIVTRLGKLYIYHGSYYRVVDNIELYSILIEMGYEERKIDSVLIGKVRRELEITGGINYRRMKDGWIKDSEERYDKRGWELQHKGDTVCG